MRKEISASKLLDLSIKRDAHKSVKRKHKKRKHLPQPVQNTPKKITINDLCPEEKAKIGELMKKLADEKKEKSELVQLFHRERSSFVDSIQTLTAKQNELLRDSAELQGRFRESLDKITELKAKKKLPETEIKPIPKIYSPPVLSEETSRIEEIASIKNEIQQISSVLKSMNFSPERKQPTEKENVSAKFENTPAIGLPHTPESIARKIVPQSSTLHDFSSLELDELLRLRGKLIDNIDAANSVLEQKLTGHIKSVDRTRNSTASESQRIVPSVCREKLAKYMRNAAQTSQTARNRIREQLQSLREQNRMLPPSRQSVSQTEPATVPRTQDLQSYDPRLVSLIDEIEKETLPSSKVYFPRLK